MQIFDIISEKTLMTIYIIIFLIPFVSIPIAVVYFHRQKKWLKETYPNQPWKQNVNWIENKIKPEKNVKHAIFYTLLAVYISIVFGVPLSKAFMENSITNSTAFYFAVAFFAMFPILILYNVIKTVLVMMKFGNTYLKLADETGVIGGRLAGLVQISRKIDVSGGFNISLRCVEVTHTKHGKSSSESENILWEDLVKVNKDALQQDLESTGIPVLFHIPFECTPCHDWEKINRYSRKCVKWKLMVSADLPGIDFENAFDIPVFKTKDSSPGVKIPDEKYDQYTVKPTLDEALQNTRISLQSNSDRDLHIIFSAKFPLLLQWLTAPIAIIMYGIVQWKVIGFFASTIGSAIAVIPIIVISIMLIIFLLLYFGINMYESQLIIHQNGIRVRSKLLFIQTNTLYDWSQIQRIYTKVKTQSQQKIQPYKLVLETGDKPRTITEIIPGKHLAELLEEKINQTVTNIKSQL